MEILLIILACWIGLYGFFAFLFGLCFDLYNEPFYFSPSSLYYRTDLNTFGIIVMTIVHFILNPLWCVCLTLGYLVSVFANGIYDVTHD